MFHDQGGLQEGLLHVLNVVLHVGADARLRAVSAEGEDGVAAEVRVAHEVHVAEGAAVPVLGPVELDAEEIGQGGLQPRVPAVAHVLDALFALELHVHLGQNEEEGGLVPAPFLGARPLGEAYPVVDGGRQILHFLVARADTEEHARKLLLIAVALEEIGHLAAQEKLLEASGAAQLFGEVRDLEAGAVAREIQKVGVVKELLGFFRHIDGEFRRQGRDHGSRQGGGLSADTLDFELFRCTRRRAV